MILKEPNQTRTTDDSPHREALSIDVEQGDMGLMPLEAHEGGYMAAWVNRQGPHHNGRLVAYLGVHQRR